jgi:hypothetical protein
MVLQYNWKCNTIAALLLQRLSACCENVLDIMHANVQQYDRIIKKANANLQLCCSIAKQ